MSGSVLFALPEVFDSNTSNALEEKHKSHEWYNW